MAAARLSSRVWSIRTSMRRTLREPRGGIVSTTRCHSASLSTTRFAARSSIVMLAVIGQSPGRSNVVRTGISIDWASAGTKNDACPPIHRNRAPVLSVCQARIPDVIDRSHGGSRRYAAAASKTMATPSARPMCRGIVSATGERPADTDPMWCR